MNAYQIIHQLLGRFSTRLGSAPLGLSERGICQFRYGDDLEISLEVPDDASTHVYLSCTVFSLAGRDQALMLGIYEELLRLNAFHPMTRGASLALDPPDSNVLLCYHYPIAALDEVSFYNLLTHFTQSASAVRAHLHGRADQRPDIARPVDTPLSAGALQAHTQLRG